MPDQIGIRAAPDPARLAVSTARRVSPCPSPSDSSARRTCPRGCRSSTSKSFCLSADDIAAVAERCRHDRRVAAAIQMLFLRASGRPMDSFASVPKMLLRAVCEACQTPAVSIASLRSLHARRHTLYEHQAWARTYLSLQDLAAAGVDHARGRPPQGYRLVLCAASRARRQPACNGSRRHPSATH